MHTTARRQNPAQLLEPKPLPETLGARAVRLARAATAIHMAEVARIKLDASARPAWPAPPVRGVCSPLAEGAD